MGAQLDRDADGIGDACDNCPLKPNPPYDLDDPANVTRIDGYLFRTTTGGQLDDDADGIGNACDGDHNGDGVVNLPDRIVLVGNLRKSISGSDCPSAGSSDCDLFDADGLGDTLQNADLSATCPGAQRVCALESYPAPRPCPACPLECEGELCDDDSDGWVNRDDNCTRHSNPSQCDTDLDGFGNACDGDFDQDSSVDARDFDDRFVPDYLAGVDSGSGSDMNCDGLVNALDFERHFLDQFERTAPGPSGRRCAGSVPCP